MNIKNILTLPTLVIVELTKGNLEPTIEAVKNHIIKLKYPKLDAERISNKILDIYFDEKEEKKFKDNPASYMQKESKTMAKKPETKEVEAPKAETKKPAAKKKGKGKK